METISIPSEIAVLDKKYRDIFIEDIRETIKERAKSFVKLVDNM